MIEEVQRRIGKPRTLSEEQARKDVLQNIAVGLDTKTSCAAAYVSDNNLKRWLMVGRAAMEDMPATMEKYGRSEEFCVMASEFALEYDRALASGEQAILRSIQTAAMTGDTNAGMWYLERLYPEKYGKLARLEVSGPDGDPLIPRDMLQSAIHRAATISDKERQKRLQASHDAPKQIEEAEAESED